MDEWLRAEARVPTQPKTKQPHLKARFSVGPSACSARALAELGVERAVICGHSYGPSPLLFGPCRSRPPFPSAGELEAGTALVSYALNRDRHRRRPRLCGAALLYSSLYSCEHRADPLHTSPSVNRRRPPRPDRDAAAPLDDHSRAPPPH